MRLGGWKSRQMVRRYAAPPMNGPETPTGEWPSETEPRPTVPSRHLHSSWGLGRGKTGKNTESHRATMDQEEIAGPQTRCLEEPSTRHTRNRNLKESSLNAIIRCRLPDRSYGGR